MRILLIEDEAPLADIVMRGLEKARYQVEWMDNGTDGWDAARAGGYDLIILDLMLPGVDGWTICRRLRDTRDRTPILMLTAMGEVDDRVRGLEMGADDYLPKPFAFAELKARVAALLRRDLAHKSRVLRIDDLEIDTDQRQVRRAGREVILTPREYDLLEALARREGQVLSKEMIQERVWGDADSYSNTVEVFIGTLRKKIDTGRAVRLIHTVHRQGYMLRRPEEAENTASAREAAGP